MVQFCWGHQLSSVPSWYIWCFYESNKFISLYRMLCWALVFFRIGSLRQLCCWNLFYIDKRNVVLALPVMQCWDVVRCRCRCMCCL